MLIHPLAGLDDQPDLLEWTRSRDLSDDSELDRFLRENVGAHVRERLDRAEILADASALRELMASPDFDAAEWLECFLIPVAELGGDGDRVLRAVLALYDE